MTRYPAPLAAEINALPEHVRAYLHDLETRADPAGDLRAARLAEDTCRQLEAELASRRWQPIDTAPLDGEEVLLTNGTDTHVVRRVFDYGEDYDTVGDWVIPGGPSWQDLSGMPPTHWMPLPKLPKETT